MFSRNSLVILGITLLMMAFPMGCSDDDESSQGQISQTQAQLQGEAALELVNAMIAASPEIANGDLTGLGDNLRAFNRDYSIANADGFERGGGDPVWDSEQNHWYLFYSVTDEDGSITVAFTIQFLDTWGAPQQQPDANTDHVDYSMAFDIQSHIEDGEGGVVDFDLDYATTMSIGGLQTATYALTGGGSMNGTISGSGSQGGVGAAPEGDWTYSTTMNWGIDVTMPADQSACPSGTVAVNVDNWTLVATYDAAQQAYAWAMFEGESTEPVASGFGTDTCEVLP